MGSYYHWGVMHRVYDADKFQALANKWLVLVEQKKDALEDYWPVIELLKAISSGNGLTNLHGTSFSFFAETKSVGLHRGYRDPQYDKDWELMKEFWSEAYRIAAIDMHLHAVKDEGVWEPGKSWRNCIMYFGQAERSFMCEHIIKLVWWQDELLEIWSNPLGVAFIDED